MRFYISFIFILFFSIQLFADELDKYMSSAEYLKDTACYTNYMVKELDNVLKGKPLRKGYESYQLLSKGQIYSEKGKAKRTIKYKTSLYKSKTGKKLSLKSCLPYGKLVSKGQKLGVQELYITEFMNNFGR